jgi:hypothetical protein
MVKTLAGTALVLALATAIAACGASRSKMAASPQSAVPESAATNGADTGAMPGGDAHGEIESLSAKIDAQRTELGLAEPAPMSAGAPPASPMATIPLSTDASCKPAKTERCQGSCTISDSICSNASRICTLAGELAGDGWAATKCARAKQTCESAHDSCCSCQ